ncbi:MAG: membrane-bound PQQ-dependent dehydrogenase, glucose/quinate/shikimate family [Rhizobiaceae bacterium]|nr:membrane-bound PQQ-dependent dehydrogenase, glucose/quinate/shikimate family [Rhizobiaceae bacterium]MCV0404831.1 membrane-bound PQQ-dependent dehydrogenase, glucose/quinate/shikimate family [Rhizobiaceae bacterium]
MRIAALILLALSGLALTAGGAWLLVLGGSIYYILAGLVLLVTGEMLRRRSGWALSLYASFLLATMIWAVGEVGFDWWALAPRGGLFVVIGVLMLAAWPLQNPERLGPRRPAWRAGGIYLGATLAVSIVLAVYAMRSEPHEIEGEVATADGQQLPPSEAAVPAGDWVAYGRTPGGSHYSPLSAITPENASRLVKAWEYRTGDIRTEGDPEETTYEVTPTRIGDFLYLCTPHHLAIALDPETGEEKWRYDAAVGIDGTRQHQTCRGLAHVPDVSAEEDGSCGSRILLPTADARLIALDAETGTECASFGENGAVDLRANMPHWYPGSYYSTSPPVVAGGLIVIGGAVNDNVSTTEPSGVIRAYDADTGELVWNFDSGNPDETEPLPPGDTYVGNSPNAWSLLSVDPELGMVYAPMGNAPPDQYGGDRTEETERFSASVTALDLETGEVRWVRQLVHHDLWDYDTPSQPQLVDLPREGGVLPALVQATKQGDIYVLDRRTGEPVLPVEEVETPQGAVEGDFTAPSQPVSAMSFAPEPLSEASMWGATPIDQLWCRIRFNRLRYEGRYTPPSIEGSIVYPGNFGTFNWGGVAIDPLRGAVIANPVYLAFTVTLIPREDDQTNYVSEGEPGFNENYGAPYAAKMVPFLSFTQLPCQQPPWGYVAAADLSTGETVWKHRNGTVRDLSPLPLPFEMGVPAIGGPIVTAGGVAFHSGTMDYYVRAFDVTTGRELWKDRLPAGGQATPMTFEGEDGRQYLVVVAGGHGSTGTKAGDWIIAYALPEE